MPRLGSSAFVRIALVVGLVACRGESFQGTGAAAGEGGSGATAAGGSGGAAGGGGVATGGGGAGAGTQGGGGSGGEAPTEEIVEVRYHDKVNALTGRVVLVSDADGETIDETVIDVEGKATVTVPHGGFVTVLDNDNPALHEVYSAQVVPGVTAVTLVRNEPPTQNSSETLSMRAVNCSNCVAGDRVDFHRSCEFAVSSAVTMTQTIVNATPSSTNGCAGVTELVASAIVYGSNGVPKAAGTAQTTFPLVVNQNLDIPVTVLAPADVATIEAPISLDVGGYTIDGIELDDLDPETLVPLRSFKSIAGNESIFNVPKTLASKLRATRALENATLGTRIIRFEDHDVESSSLPPFGVTSLSLPTAPQPLDFADPVQPKWTFALGNESVGAGVALFAFTSGITWSVVVPASTTAVIALPKIPTEHAAFRLPAIALNQGILHVALGEQHDYADLVSGGLSIIDDSPWFPVVTMASSQSRF